ncbi:MAG: glutamate 5-kinase [Gammaproteobacteria bacterium]|nr:glutamate 5-kinase [Gammaproteobacteria bacterium]
MTREVLKSSRRWVVKVGSSLVTDPGRGLDRAAIADWGDQVARLRESGCEVVLVSSGAVAEGMRRLRWQTRPHALHELQAAASVGQMGLVQAYESCFQQRGLHAAQVLLTHDDLVDRQRYLNARSTLRTLLRLGVIPVVNENDTVAGDKIRLGDNDTLAALVANLVEAELLVILTDRDGLFDKDPAQHADAQLLQSARANDARLDQLAGPSPSAVGRGGMITKVFAARRAAASGATTIIASGRSTDVLARLRQSEELGTVLTPDQAPLLARKQWLASQLQLRGMLVLDDGARRALLERNSSLLAVGVTAVKGNFVRGEVVACIGDEGTEIARGLVNYSAAEARQIQGQPSGAIETILGYVDEPELIDRDNMVITLTPDQSESDR